MAVFNKFRICEPKNISVGVTSTQISFENEVYRVEIFNSHNSNIVYVQPNDSTPATIDCIPVLAGQRYIMNSTIHFGHNFSLISSGATTPVSVAGFF